MFKLRLLKSSAFWLLTLGSVSWGGATLASAQCSSSDSTGCCGSPLCAAVYSKINLAIAEDMRPVRDALSVSGAALTEQERQDLLTVAKQYFTAQRMDLLLNRFGYGPSSAETGLSLSNPTDENVRRLLVALTRDAEVPSGFLTPNLRRLAEAYSAETPHFKIPFNPILMGPEEINLLHASIIARGLAPTSGGNGMSEDSEDPAAAGSGSSGTITLDQQVRQDAAFIRNAVLQGATQFRLLMSSFGSQSGVAPSQRTDEQVNFAAVLQEFWFNHFNVDYKKITKDSAFGPGGYEHTIHLKMTTTFYDLLRSVITHPAMLRYLDNQTNIFSPQTLVASNQNLGRELLELHTFGLGANRGFNSKVLYTQSDVEGSSLLLTGLNLSPARDGYGTRVNPLNHVPDYVGARQTAPVVMGKRFCLISSKVMDATDSCARTSQPLTEEQLRSKVNVQLSNYLHFLANHERTKRNICFKLASKFVSARFVDSGVADDETTTRNESMMEILRAPVIDRCIAAWGEDGNLKSMYAAILLSPEVWMRDNFRRYTKNPLELVVSAVRASGMTAGHFVPTTHVAAFGKVLQDKVAALGLPYRQWMTPTGYNELYGWMSPGYLVRWLKASADLANFFESRSIGTNELYAPLMGVRSNGTFAGSTEEDFLTLEVDGRRIGEARLTLLRSILGDGDVRTEPKNVEARMRDILSTEQKMVKQRVDGRLYPVPLKTGVMLKTASFLFTRK